MRRTCRLCGREYETCWSCDRKHGWKTLTDTAEHYYILITLMRYQTDRDAAAAKEALLRRGFDFGTVGEYVQSANELLREIEEN